MRLPGAATLEVLELTPEADVVATIGEELAQGTTEALDGGAPADPSDDGGLR